MTVAARNRDRTRAMAARCLATLIALTVSTLAGADTPPPPDDAHLAYGTLCDREEPIRVEITATAKGPKVTLVRRANDPGPFETLDVNFAHVSRRLFFKARTSEGLIEFQGRALADALVGLYSDDRGVTRSITLHVASADTTCPGAKHDKPL